MKNRYVRVSWAHGNTYDPVEIYSELDELSYEVRRVERFPDGSLDFASRSERGERRTFLSPEPFSSIAEINSNPEFSAAEIAKDEFEKAWQMAYGDSAGPPPSSETR